MKLAHLVWLPLLAAGPSTEADDLRVVYRTGEAVVCEERDWAAMELSGVSARANGRTVPEQALKDMGVSIPPASHEDRVRTTTWLEELEDGRPLRALRRFDALERTGVEGGEESAQQGVIAGRTLLITGSADDSGTEARPAEGDTGPEIEAAYLERHRLTYQVERYLPPRPVEVGATWRLGDAAVREVLGLDGGGGPTYFAFNPENSALAEALGRSGKVSGKVTYARREEVDGEICAVLRIELTLKAEWVEVDPADFRIDPEGFDTSARLSCDVSGEELVWLALEDGRPVRHEGDLGGSMEMAVRLSSPEQRLNMEIDFGVRITSGGESTWTLEER
jgi:hypothetical protein